MSISRRGLIMGGVAVGTTGLAVAARLADRYSLIPPDGGGIWGPGRTLTYAAQRLLTRNSLAREFSRRQISEHPVVHREPPKDEVYLRMKAGSFADWRIVVDGMVARPAALSVAELRSFPSRTQITHLACEEGWSFIAEWTGVPLSQLLERAGAHPHAKFVAYFSHQSDWWDSVDMADALHPQTLVTYGMNGGLLPEGHGGPVRLRVPRQLGYKSVKYITRLTVTDSLKGFGQGKGSASVEYGDAWYSGI